MAERMHQGVEAPRSALPAVLAIVLWLGVLAPMSIHAAPASEPVTDVSGWQRLLDERLQPLRQYDTDRSAHVAASLFDYRGLAAEPGVLARLDSIRAELLQVPPSRMAPAERLAWAIDTYDFLVVDRIVRETMRRP